MESTIAAQCFVVQDTGLMLDMAGNKLPAGSVIKGKLTPFIIPEDGDIDHVGGDKMKMVYKADDKYFKFLNQQVKELHMERSQRFITSMFRALTGSRHKIRRKQVTGIPPTLVTIGSHTLTTPVDAPTSKTLAEDVTQAELVARQPATLENQWRSLAQTMSWESLMWQMFNEMVNMFHFLLVMWRNTCTSQIILMNS